MYSKRLCVAIAAAGLLATTGTAAAAPNTAFTNGSFETPKAREGAWTSFPAGSDMGLWNVGGGGVDLIDDGLFQAAEGSQSVDLNGQGPGSVSQTFTTEPGKQYTVTYSLSGTPAPLPIPMTGNALIDGQKFQDFTFDTSNNTPQNMGYVTHQFTFVANRASTTLKFASTTDSSSYGPIIDDVKVKGCSCS